MAPRNKTAGLLCIVGGALLVVAGTIGMKPLLEEILKYIQPAVDASPILAIVFRVLIFIAALGTKEYQSTICSKDMSHRRWGTCWASCLR